MFNVQCLTDFSAINILDSDLWNYEWKKLRFKSNPWRKQLSSL